jgi:pyrroline-5-carboxylate reductase
MKKLENIGFIGSGIMGRLFGGEEAVSLRFTADFMEVLKDKELVFLAGRQQEGLQWVSENGQLLSGKLVASIMAFTEFEALEVATANNQTKFVRVMTDTSLETITWSDDGRLTTKEKEVISSWLSGYGETEYIGERNDKDLLKETIKACQLGWLAQALAELTDNMGEEVLVKVLEQRQKGLSFSEIAQAVATKGGATEAGIDASMGLFGQAQAIQSSAGLARAREKSAKLLEFAKLLV